MIGQDSHHSPVKPTVNFSQQQLIELLQGADDDGLFKQAAQVTAQHFNRQVYLRAVIEFSNYCRNDCHYCGLRANNRSVNRYRLSETQIIDAAVDAERLGMGTVVLQSGDDSRYSAATIERLIIAIKRETSLAITLSVGDRSRQEFELWRQAGADRYLLKMETFDAALFSATRPKANFDERLEKLAQLKSLGYQVGSGIITDLPSTTDAIMARDILALTALQLDMIACGPFVAHPLTPMAQHTNGCVMKSQRLCALLRLLNPLANIPATSALDALAAGSRLQALQRGSNVIMPSFTPLQVSQNYGIYPGKNCHNAELTQRISELKQQIIAIGLSPVSHRGDSLRTSHV
ncbi:[FeFe] hydrogenase H-cluster radical SAM maturase HydE [Shewanella sp. NIFS-20-20]|uniref:[FeFe] hydrogenase H-cluster radical SAM maturase HydE n=1 Tax=Shewanella sp. NIFS-20-20 TaxID=2853806 RepID=UPI001C467591|nr:[FeFe] hydrogenase H-cluster radical SAM maturase HydE [Shewanella sp. NIFS-20-20]MBV7316916.1 [FeFe] hydrogenase H-cluster radical SAM maturase HydE [Shewanella sp. NIFS-20-20]